MLESAKQQEKCYFHTPKIVVSMGLFIGMKQHELLNEYVRCLYQTICDQGATLSKNLQITYQIFLKHALSTKNNGHRVFHFDQYLVLKDQFLVSFSTLKPFLVGILLFKVNKKPPREQCVKPIQSYFIFLTVLFSYLGCFLY